MSAELPRTESDSSAAPASERILKISCHNCMQKLDVTSLTPFSHISCPSCGAGLIVPEWFDDYLLEEPGGAGGIAMVYRALDLALDREVAIKILKPEIACDAARSELFLREARTAATINHYAVVPIYTCGVFEEKPYIIMQYMAGGSLEQKLHQSPDPLPLGQVMRWIYDIASGLENAELHGIIHHDVKPGNILLDVEGNAKIGDFGIAQILSDGLPGAGNLLSPHYVSPEKVRTGEDGVPGDIYSLGATFYHLVTGVTPFRHDDKEELLRMRLTADPAAPHLLRKDVGIELSHLILSMMNRDPEARPSYKTVTTELNRIIKGKKTAPVPLSARSILKKHGPSAGTVRKQKKSSPVFFFILLLIFVLTVAGAITAWKTGFLDFQEPEAGPTAKVPKRRADPPPAAVFHFAMGDPAAALLCADLELQKPDISLHRRATALFQAACALYLKCDPQAGQGISARLSVMNDLYSASELMRENTLLSLVDLLAGSESDGSEPPAGGSGAACAAATRLFLAMSRGPDAANNIPELLSVLEGKLAGLSGSNWLVSAWKNRVGIWKGAVLNRAGWKNGTEPLAARWIKRDEPAFIHTSDMLPGTPEDWMAKEPGSWKNESTEQPDVSAAALKAAADPYVTNGRPRPKAPSKLRKIAAPAYLNSLTETQQASEKLRLRMMSETLRFIAEASARVPYQADSFLTVDGRQLEAGTWIFNPYFMIRRTETQTEQLDWEQASVPEMMNIMLYYTARLEAETEDGAQKSSLRLLMYYVRYALFAQWYGYYEEAAKYAQKAVTASPDQNSAAFIRFLLLR